METIEGDEIMPTRKKPVRMIDGRPHELVVVTQDPDEVQEILDKLAKHNEKGRVIKDKAKGTFSVYRFLREEEDKEVEE